MGQKVNPIGLRVGINIPWKSKWFATKDSAKFVGEDYAIRRFVKDTQKAGGIAFVDIERAADKVKVAIYAARPGVLIGKRGVGIEQVKAKLQKFCSSEVLLNIHEVRKPELSAQLIAENVAQQLERRVAFRRAMKKAVAAALKFGAKGIRISCSGRLGGAEMSRREWYREGRVPLHTLRADIDYGLYEAKTTYGIIGVKVWIYRGEVLGKEMQKLG